MSQPVRENVVAAVATLLKSCRRLRWKKDRERIIPPDPRYLTVAMHCRLPGDERPNEVVHLTTFEEVQQALFRLRAEAGGTR